MIPLTEHKVSVGDNKAVQDAELYKKAYAKHFFKKANVNEDYKNSPGSLITGKKLRYYCQFCNYLAINHNFLFSKIECCH